MLYDVSDTSGQGSWHGWGDAMSMRDAEHEHGLDKTENPNKQILSQMKEGKIRLLTDQNSSPTDALRGVTVLIRGLLWAHLSPGVMAQAPTGRQAVWGQRGSASQQGSAPVSCDIQTPRATC